MMDVQMSDLYNPQMLTIRIENSNAIFRVPRGLLCPKSAYFKSAFRKETFKEGREHSIELSSDVSEWVLQCFLGWVYTQRIFWQPQPRELKQWRYETAFEHSDDEDDPQIPVTWPWEVIIQLYVFGDRYDTKGFRNAIMDVALLKALQVEPRSYLPPGIKQQAQAYKRLPATSELYRLMLEIGVHEVEKTASADQWSPEALGRHLPSEALATLYCLASRLSLKLACPACKAGHTCERNHASMSLRATFRTHLLWYYEHESTEEELDCFSKWFGLRTKHKLDIVLVPRREERPSIR